MVTREQRPYHRLTVWRKGMDLADAVHDAVGTWPAHERFELRSQARRASFSVPANIAEGQGRFGKHEYLHHLSIAYGSLNETETVLLFAQRRGYLSVDDLDRLMDQAGEVGHLLVGLMRRLRQLLKEERPEAG